MESQEKKKPFKYRFDFEIGYLIKSPCRGCEDRPLFPQCIKACRILDDIHTLMAESVSCSKGS
jgi:hypothetical protein